MNKALIVLVGFGEFKATFRIDHVFLRFFVLLAIALEKCSFLAARISFKERLNAYTQKIPYSPN